MKTFSRSTALKIAAVLSLIVNGYSAVFALPLVAHGADTVNQNPDYLPVLCRTSCSLVTVIG